MKKIKCSIFFFIVFIFGVISSNCQNLTDEQDLKSYITISSFNDKYPDKAEFGNAVKISSTSPDIILKRSYYLVINGIHLTRLLPQQLSGNNELTFILKNNTIDETGLKLSDIINPRGINSISVNIGVVNNRGELLYARNDFSLVFDRHGPKRTVIGMILFLILIWVIFKMSKKGNIIGNMLKDSCKIDNKPYSLSKSQLAFWTLIIIFAFIYIWMRTSQLIEISDTILVLLGISMGTNIGGRVIDQNDLSNPEIKMRHQNVNSSGSFLSNIMSDSTGMSIHRFQNVIFSIVIGSYFLFEVFTTNVIPDLNTNLLVLMGISSAGYLVIKNGENRNLPLKPVNTEIKTSGKSKKKKAGAKRKSA